MNLPKCKHPGPRCKCLSCLGTLETARRIVARAPETDPVDIWEPMRPFVRAAKEEAEKERELPRRLAQIG